MAMSLKGASGSYGKLMIVERVAVVEPPAETTRRAIRRPRPMVKPSGKAGVKALARTSWPSSTTSLEVAKSPVNGSPWSGSRFSSQATLVSAPPTLR